MRTPTQPRSVPVTEGGSGVGPHPPGAEPRSPSPRGGLIMPVLFFRAGGGQRKEEVYEKAFSTCFRKRGSKIVTQRPG